MSAIRTRSPNYPSINLGDAIDRVQKVFEKASRHSLDALLAANLMGYKSLNGGSLTAIANLKKYGLLTEVGKQLQVSELAVRILHPEGASEYLPAITEAAFSSSLFEDLHLNFGSALPDNEVMKSFLIKRGFKPTVVDLPIRCYRETLQFVESKHQEYNGADSVTTSEPVNMNAISTADNLPVVQKGQAQRYLVEPKPFDDVLLVSNDSRQDVFSLDEGRVVLQWPAKMSQDSFEDFESWIQIQLRKIKRSVTRPDQGPDVSDLV